MSCNFCGGRLNNGMLRKQEREAAESLSRVPTVQRLMVRNIYFIPIPLILVIRRHE